MTKTQLKSHYELGIKIRKSKNTLTILRGSYKTTPTLTGMPRGNEPGDKVGNLAAAATDLEMRIKKEETIFNAQNAEIKNYIAAADDPVTYTALDLHYIKCLSWQTVAVNTGNTEDAIKKACYRWIDAHQN